MSVIQDETGPKLGTQDLTAYMKAAALLAGLVVGGAIIWGLIGYFTEGIYYAVGILIGIGITRVFAEPLRPINFLKGVLVFGGGTVLSLITIALGEFLVSAIYLKFKLGYALAKSIGVCLENLVDILSTEAALIGYAMVLIGVLIGLVNAIREPSG